MKEVIRIRCPACGMMTDLDQMVKTSQEKPAEIRIFRQRMGGKVAGEFTLGKKGKGSAKGFMEYIDITDEVLPDQMATLKNWFDQRIKKYQEGKK